MYQLTVSPHLNLGKSTLGCIAIIKSRRIGPWQRHTTVVSCCRKILRLCRSLVVSDSERNVQTYYEGIVLYRAWADHFRRIGIYLFKECILVFIETSPIQFTRSAVKLHRLSLWSDALHSCISNKSQFAGYLVKFIQVRLAVHCIQVSVICACQSHELFIQVGDLCVASVDSVNLNQSGLHLFASALYHYSIEGRGGIVISKVGTLVRLLGITQLQFLCGEVISTKTFRQITRSVVRQNHHVSAIGISASPELERQGCQQFGGSSCRIILIHTNGNLTIIAISRHKPIDILCRRWGKDCQHKQEQYTLAETLK